MESKGGESPAPRGSWNVTSTSSLRSLLIAAFVLSVVFSSRTAQSDAPGVQGEVVTVDAGHPVKPSELFQKVQGWVYPLKTALGPSAPKKSYGTAFVVDPSGVLATNFHVVADAVHEPGKYQLYLDLSKEGVPGSPASIPAEILTFDIIHDLALVKVDRTFNGSFSISSESEPLPAPGERLWSLGKPLDLNMSLVEGNFNGEIQLGDYSEFFLSTPLNPGMSGGPTLDQLGMVRGVNFAIHRKGQNISFAVPGRFLSRLVSLWRSEQSTGKGMLPLGPSERKERFARLLEEQIISAGSTLVGEFLKASESGTAGIPVGKGGWKLSAVPPDLKCWQDQVDRNDALQKKKSLTAEVSSNGPSAAEGDRETLTATRCGTQFQVDLDGGMSVGEILFRVVNLESDQALVTPSDWRKVSDQIAKLSKGVFEEFLEERGSVARRAEGRVGQVCRKSFYAPIPGAQNVLEASFCLDRYQQYPGLYDLALRIVGSSSQGNALLFGVQARGFGMTAVKGLTAHFLKGILPQDGMRESPAPSRMPASEGTGFGTGSAPMPLDSSVSSKEVGK